MTPDDQVEVRGVADVPVALPIGGGAPTGYSWQLELPDGVAVAAPTAPEDAPAGRRMGAGSGSRRQVVAAAPGRYVITARLARPWEGEPVRRLTITLVVE